jgi:hypothetical protein
MISSDIGCGRKFEEIVIEVIYHRLAPGEGEIKNPIVSRFGIPAEDHYVGPLQVVAEHAMFNGKAGLDAAGAVQAY